MFASVLSLCLCLPCGAPVPYHLMKPPPDPIVPGFRWLYWDGCYWYDLEITRIDGDCISYRCRNMPKKAWGANVQSRDVTLSEWRRFGEPIGDRYKPLETPEW